MTYEKIVSQLEPYVNSDYLKLKQLCDKKNSSIVVFGAGNYGKYILRQLIKRNMGNYVLGICDNSEKMWGGR